MSQLNIKELYNTINQKTLKRMEVYDRNSPKMSQAYQIQCIIDADILFFPNTLVYHRCTVV